MKNKVRTFIAIEIDRAIRTRAGELIALLSGTAADVKWVELQNLHLTLKFLGDVHQRDILAVCRAVQHGAAELAPMLARQRRRARWLRLLGLHLREAADIGGMTLEGLLRQGHVRYRLLVARKPAG